MHDRRRAASEGGRREKERRALNTKQAMEGIISLASAFHQDIKARLLFLSG